MRRQPGAWAARATRRAVGWVLVCDEQIESPLPHIANIKRQTENATHAVDGEGLVRVLLAGGGGREGWFICIYRGDDDETGAGRQIYVSLTHHTHTPAFKHKKSHPPAACTSTVGRNAAMAAARLPASVRSALPILFVFSKGESG